MLKVQEGNRVTVSGTAVVTGEVIGTGNVVDISSAAACEVRLSVRGNNNVIAMHDIGATKGLSVRVGNHRAADRCHFSVRPGCTFEGQVQALLYQDGTKITIGRDCMVSNSVVLRGAEHPHLIFDKNTGAYLDVSDGIHIGDHVWLGEGAYLTKNASVPEGSIVAARAVVTRRFDVPNVVLGGNPARVVRQEVEWLRGRSSLVRGSTYERAYRETKARLAGVPDDEQTFWAWSRDR